VVAPDPLSFVFPFFKYLAVDFEFANRNLEACSNYLTITNTSIYTDYFLSGCTEPLSLIFFSVKYLAGGFGFANRDGRCQLYLIKNRRKGEKKSAPNRRKMQVGVIW
jgi:hypothetical protein